MKIIITILTITTLCLAVYAVTLHKQNSRLENFAHECVEVVRMTEATMAMDKLTIDTAEQTIKALGNNK